MLLYSRKGKTKDERKKKRQCCITDNKCVHFDIRFNDDVDKFQIGFRSR